EVLGRGGVGLSGPRHGARLRFPLSGRLDRRDPEQIEEPLRLLDHLIGHARGLAGLRPRRREIADLHGLPPFALRAPLDLPAGLEGSRFQSRRLAVEDEHRLDAGLDDVRCPIDESRQVGRHATLPVHQGRTVRLTDDREKLIQRVESVDRQDLSGEVLKFPRLEDDDVREIDAHPGDRGRGILKSFLEQLSRLNVRTSGPTVYAPASAYRVSDGGRFVVGESRGFSGAEGIEAGRTRMGRIVAIEVLVVSLSFLLGVLVIAPPASATDPIEDLGTLPGDESSRATAINGAGQIVGISGTCSDPTHAFLWADGVMTDLGSLPGTVRTYPSDINNAGQVVGTGRDASWNPYAFLWEDGVMTALGNFSAASINDAGQIAGWVWTSSGSHPALWENSTLTDLGTPDPTRVYGEANDINNAGQIVGETFTEDHDGIGFLWDTGTWTDLGALPNDSASWAYAINDAGQIAGSSGSRYEETSGFRWESGVMTDLGNLGGPQDPYTKAAGMNAAG